MGCTFQKSPNISNLQWCNKPTKSININFRESNKNKLGAFQGWIL